MRFSVIPIELGPTFTPTKVHFFNILPLKIPFILKPLEFDFSKGQWLQVCCSACQQKALNWPDISFTLNWDFLLWTELLNFSFWFTCQLNCVYIPGEPACLKMLENKYKDKPQCWLIVVAAASTEFIAYAFFDSVGLFQREFAGTLKTSYVAIASLLSLHWGCACAFGEFIGYLIYFNGRL